MGVAAPEKTKDATSNGNGGGTSEVDLKRMAAEAEAGEGGGDGASGPGGEQLEGEHPDEQPKPGAPKIELEGVGQLSLKIGGGDPDKATAKLVGGKIAIPKGEYQPGEYVEAVVKLRVSKVSINHKVNDGETVEVEREHQFKLVQIEKVTGA